MNRTAWKVLPILCVAMLGCDSTAPASPPAQSAPPPPRAAAPPDAEIAQTVARLSLVAGGVSFARGDDPDTWEPADLNVPMTLGDRVWTGDDGRIELQVHGGNVVRLAARTDLQALNLTDAVKQLSLALGTASFSIRRLSDDEVFEVDTPNAAVTLERPGDYRIDVNENGDSRVQVRRGRAVASAGGGQVTLAAGEELEIEGVDAPRYQMVALPPTDGWDRWVEEREQRLAAARSSAYVTPDIVGVEELDQSGRWQQIPQYGWVWTPVGVEVGWAPYRSGRWIWQDPWGWTWVAAEPWGWAPYHYGRWTYWGSAWYWVPVGPAIRTVAYSPALVAFVGGTAGYVGWFPLAPHDPYYPWWRRGPTVSVTNVTYVNRTYVTVVNQTTFVSGRSVSRALVSDRAVVQSVERAPVLRGPIPVVPTRESLRMTTREAPAPRPPATASRQVVTRVAPPPPPPRFDTKVAVIREKGGAPIAPADAARLTAQSGNATATRGRTTTSTARAPLQPKDTSRPAATAVPAPPTAPPRTTRPPEGKTSEPGRPPARGMRPTPHATPRAEPTPESARTQHVQKAPVPRESAQPAERIAPPPQSEHQRARPTPKPQSKKSPTKKPEKKAEG
ncbi:MAG TPA: DUF6600 domain-containing protein [Thermoanaerobaculia bacterium]|nr:DUF6600 domain-containing protein [Thermoanaerobaculia bacterium]